MHTGGTDGQMLTFDLQTGEAVGSQVMAADTVNGLQFHPFLPLVATASGALPLISCIHLLRSRHARRLNQFYAEL